MQAHTVYANDEFEYSFGLSPTLHHVPAKTDRGEPVFYYAVFQTKSGGYGFEVMSVEDVRQHAIKYSKAYSSSSSPWKTNFDEMAKKTVLKRRRAGRNDQDGDRGGYVRGPGRGLHHRRRDRRSHGRYAGRADGGVNYAQRMVKVSGGFLRLGF